MHRRPTRRREGTQTAHNRRGKQGPEHAPGNVLAAQPGGGRRSRKLPASSWGRAALPPAQRRSPDLNRSREIRRAVPSPRRGWGERKGGMRGPEKGYIQGKHRMPCCKAKTAVRPTQTPAGWLPAGGREGMREGRGGICAPLIPTPPSGRVVASQTARASGVTWHGGGCRLRTWGSAGRAVGRNRGDVFQLGGWASGKKKKKKK